ncbi:MAG: helix-turn-helix domain-containing protein [Candidatus Competibacteraceae bacterium]|nr:helix-turn-helix domain-containing protein [Candidatus Competibacteraceae bacterium]
MLNLDDIISSLEGLEIKRALAVQMLVHNFKTKEICALLDVSDSFVSKWKVIYENEGAEGLRVNYKGVLDF